MLPCAIVYICSMLLSNLKIYVYIHIEKLWAQSVSASDTVLEEPEGSWYSLSSVPVQLLDIVVPCVWSQGSTTNVYHGLAHHSAQPLMS